MGSYKNADWAYYNRGNIENASNGGNNNLDRLADWRTLTREEWNYILNTRANAASKQGYACIDGQYYGLVVLPDVWTLPPGLSFTSGAAQWESLNNNYSLADWSRMEAAGALFLPTAGCRCGTSFYNSYYGPGRSISGLGGCYWTSSYGGGYPYELFFVNDSWGGITLQTGRRRYADAVRPARVNMLQSDEDED